MLQMRIEQMCVCVCVVYVLPVRTDRQGNRQGTGRDKRRRQLTYWRACCTVCVCLALPVAQSFISHNLISGVDFGIRQGGVMAPRSNTRARWPRPARVGPCACNRCMSRAMEGVTCISSVAFFSGRAKADKSRAQQSGSGHPGLAPQACVDQISIRGAEAVSRVAQPTAHPRGNFSPSRVMRGAC